MAGHKIAGGYVQIRTGGKAYYAHRLAWLFTHGDVPAILDHANGDRSDNRIVNIRAATTSQNAWNSVTPSHNSSGFKGVSWDSGKQKWRAKVVALKGKHHLGFFDSAGEAAEAVRQKRPEVHREFTNHG